MPEFDDKSIRRIAKTVVGWERFADDRTDGPPAARGGPPAETCWGKLTAKVTDGFEWTEQFRKIGDDDKPTWAAKSNARAGNNAKPDSEKNLAVEEPAGSAPAVGTVVLLRRAVTLAKKASPSEPDKWLSRWVIVATPPTALHGKLTTAWVPGTNTVTLKPVAGPLDATELPDDAIAAYISYPLNKPAVCLAADAGDILGFEKIGGTDDAPVYMLRNAPQMPRPSAQFQVISNEAATGANWQAAYTAAHDV